MQRLNTLTELTETEKAFLILQNICLDCRINSIDIHDSTAEYPGICIKCALNSALKSLREFNAQFK